MDSTYKVPYTTIVNITPHSNAERLEVAWIYGFQVIVQKDKYKVGDKVIYIPIDSVLSEKVESLLFSADSKVKLNKGRVRQIRLRGLASQGMAVSPEEVVSIVNLDKVALETDLSAILDITKYEPPQTMFNPNTGGSKQRNKRHENPLFHKYNGLSNIKWFPDMFKEGDSVVIQEKLHGTNARASILPYASTTIWKRIKKFLGLAPKFENCYGSNNVEISAKTNYTGFYGEDVYGSTFKSIDVFSKIRLGETVFGEIIGEGIQKGYAYGLKEHRFVLFDVKVLEADGSQKWLTPSEVESFAKERGFEYVPVLYAGAYNKELAFSLTKGNSAYDVKQKVREGIVIKASTDYCVGGNKQALKWVSEDYLNDSSNTDFH